MISVLGEAWTELDLTVAVAQACWWATFADYVIGLGLLLLASLWALVAGGGVREVAMLLRTPSVGLMLGAGAVCLFHRQEVKGLCRTWAELQLCACKRKLGKVWPLLLGTCGGEELVELEHGARMGENRKMKCGYSGEAVGGKTWAQPGGQVDLEGVC